MECMGFSGCMDVAMDLMERFTKGGSPFRAPSQTLTLSAQGAWHAVAACSGASEQPPFICVRLQDPYWQLVAHPDSQVKLHFL